jgi:hypothetical protein
MGRLTLSTGNAIVGWTATLIMAAASAIFFWSLF